jgi:hypothetical protein
MMIKTFEEFVNESLYYEDEGYKLTIVVVDKSGKKNTEYVNQSFETMYGAREYMKDLINKGCSIKYFDICSGEYHSDPEFLEIWGGYDGHFYNVVNSGYKENQQFSYKELKYIEKCEVDIEEYLEKNKKT